MSSLQIVPAIDVPAEALAAFFRAVWDKSATAESVDKGRQSSAAMNVVDPGAPLPGIAAVREGVVIGYCSSMPYPLWRDGQTVPAYCAKGLMVLPEWRQGPLGFHLAKALTETLPRAAAIAVAAPAVRIFTAIGMRDYGVLPNQLFPLRPGRIAQRLSPATLGLSDGAGFAATALRGMQRIGLAGLGAALGGALLALWQSWRDRDAREPAMLWERPAAKALDGLADRLGTQVAAGQSRSGDAVLARYFPTSNNTPYVFLRSDKGDDMEGWLALRRPRLESDPRLRGLRVATVVDLFCDLANQECLQSLLRGAEIHARSMGADVLLASASHRHHRAAMRRRGWLNRGGTLHFLYKPAPNEAWPASLGDWWLQRGDGLGDESF